jgi:MFS-type transporter involved in bile tolerance (Atg22 family)
MMCLGTYWSWYLYSDWQENPVLTTVTTTALPVINIDFPAVTICSEGLTFTSS